MESIAEFLARNPYVTLTSVLVGIISLVYAIVSSIIGRKFKRITYTKKTNKIVSLKNVGVGSLHLLFNDEEITDVSITRIAVWNSGKEVIKPSDIVDSEPLRLCLREGCEKNTRILDCSIDYVIKKSVFKNNTIPSLSLDNKCYPITFQYLNSSFGMIIQIIHTGRASDIYMDCQIMGGKSIIEVENDGSKIIPNIPYVHFNGASSWGIDYISTLLTIFIILLGLEMFVFYLMGMDLDSSLGRIISLFILIIPTVIGIIVYPFSFIKIPKYLRKEL